MSRARHIGIVAVSAEGAALCYRTICSEGAALLGRHDHPEVTLHTYPLARYMPPTESGRWEEAAELLLASAKLLVAAGAELLICPDNTIHAGVELIRESLGVPWLHIAEEVASVAVNLGYRRLGLLGTRYLMEGNVYRDKLSARGLDYELPNVAARHRINDIIFDELVYGRFEAPAREFFQGEIRALAARGCSAVVLGCTEIPLLISPGDSSLPVLDSTRILARAALQAAVLPR
jgi:aspartate racemase